MPDKVALVIGPTGATGGPIAASLARRAGWRVYGMSRTAPSGEAPFTHIAADLPPAVQRLTWFRRDDITGIADFIAGQRQR